MDNTTYLNPTDFMKHNLDTKFHSLFKMRIKERCEVNDLQFKLGSIKGTILVYESNRVLFSSELLIASSIF